MSFVSLKNKQNKWDKFDILCEGMLILIVWSFDRLNLVILPIMLTFRYPNVTRRFKEKYAFIKHLTQRSITMRPKTF